MHYRSRVALVLLALIPAPLSIFAQTGEPAAAASSMEKAIEAAKITDSGTPVYQAAAGKEATSSWGLLIAPALVQPPNPQLAMSSPSYKVTAGDLYQLSYAAGETPVNYYIVVDHSYRVRVSNLGVINVRNLSFIDFKNQVEAIVTKNYPLSGVQFALATPSSFTVNIKGEVHGAAEVLAWPLSRVSHIIYSCLTEYSSIRNVEIQSMDGSKKAVDLFKAKRDGDTSQDPFVRPGDTIIVQRMEKAVSIEGQVERPGKYQLLANEGLKDVVEYYASGLTYLADTSRVEVTSFLAGGDKTGIKEFLNQKDIDDNRALSSWDTIIIPRSTDLLPVVFVEGAIGSDSKELVESSNRRIIQYTNGENYGPFVRRIASLILPSSDTANAYIQRADKQIPLDLNPLLYDSTYYSEISIEPGDKLIIPFRQSFVSVSGAVFAPGRYPYIPDRGWDYYIGLAGGFDPQKNKNKLVTIHDLYGNTHDSKTLIAPEFNIHAETNSFIYYFKEYAPVITTVLSLGSTIFTIIAVIRD